MGRSEREGDRDSEQWLLSLPTIIGLMSCKKVVALCWSGDMERERVFRLEHSLNLDEIMCCNPVILELKLQKTRQSLWACDDFTTFLQLLIIGCSGSCHEPIMHIQDTLRTRGARIAYFHWLNVTALANNES